MTEETNLKGTVLITGSTGFVGSLLVKTLIQTGQYKNGQLQVIGLVRSLEKAEEMYRGFDISGVRFVPYDLAKAGYEELREKLSGIKIDYILHCASITQSKLMIEQPVEVADVVVFGTKKLLDLARECQVKSMVYLSSMEVYGYVEEAKERVSEEQQGIIEPLRERSCYPLGKAMAENYCYGYYKEYGVPVKIARLAQVFGKGTLPGENRIFAQIAHAILSKQDIVLRTAGRSISNYCDSEDAVRALLLILMEGIDGEAYNVVNEETTMRICEMAELAAEKVARGSISVRYEMDGNKAHGYAKDTNLRMSSKKLMQLGWKPTKGLEEMYREMIQELENAL